MNKFYLLILLGLVIRLILAFLPGFRIDVDVWAAWAYRVFDLGFIKFYSETVWTNYTPGYIYILYVLGAINKLLGLSPEVFYFLLKLPSIISELILATLIFKIVKEKSSFFISMIAASLILFNPGFIFNSSVWGQIDGLLSLLVVLSIYYLTKNKFILSSLTFSLAVLIKPQALFLSPLFIFFTLRNFNLKNILKLVIPGSFLALLLSLPFFISEPLTGLVELIVKMSNDYPVSSLFAYNFWGVVGFWIQDSTIWNNLTYRQWGLLLLGLYNISLAYFYCEETSSAYFKKSMSLYSLAALVFLSFYFLPTRVHERYLYTAIPFIILAASQFRSTLLFSSTIILSLIHFLNIYYVYVYYNELFSNSTHVLYWGPLYNLLDQNDNVLSLVATMIFLYISLVIIRLNYVKKDS